MAVSTPSDRILRPFLRFAKHQSSGGILLFVATLAALIWANSANGQSYFDLWQTTFEVRFGDLSLSKPLAKWINDGLMVVFFFVVGMEIKREALHGELASPSRLMFPLAAAIGGMAAPALLYSAFNAGEVGASGWGIPMATDIAFALGIMSLLGKRVPLTLKVFLTALAIIDDLGAVVVIALFYSEGISFELILIAHGLLAIAALANLLGFRHPLLYGLLGLAMWLALIKSGVHATVGGVLMALTIPARPRIDRARFLTRARDLLHRFEHDHGNGTNESHAHSQSTIQELEAACTQVETPAGRLERMLHPWVAFLILPLFAFANAGVALGEDLGATILQPVAIGTIVGLFVGKPLGVLVCAWLAVRLGWAAPPEGANWRQIGGVACLTGIGFTMSLFIANLGLSGTLIDEAKVGILIASAASAALGVVLLATASRPVEPVVDERAAG